MKEPSPPRPGSQSRQRVLQYWRWVFQSPRRGSRNRTPVLQTLMKGGQIPTTGLQTLIKVCPIPTLVLQSRPRGLQSPRRGLRSPTPVLQYAMKVGQIPKPISHVMMAVGQITKPLLQDTMPVVPITQPLAPTRRPESLNSLAKAQILPPVPRKTSQGAQTRIPPAHLTPPVSRAWHPPSLHRVDRGRLLGPELEFACIVNGKRAGVGDVTTATQWGRRRRAGALGCRRVLRLRRCGVRSSRRGSGRGFRVALRARSVFCR